MDGFDQGFALGILVMLIVIGGAFGMTDSMIPNEMCLERGFWDTTNIGGEYFCIRGTSDEGGAEIWPAEWVDKYCSGDGTCDMERAERDEGR